MQPLRIAILGQGRSGRNIHGRNLLAMPEKFKVAAVVEPLEERRSRAITEYPDCKVYADYTQLFGHQDEFDLVVNATPSYLHLPITKDLLSHGFNVLCEKPFCLIPEQVSEAEQCAMSNHKKLAVFQQSRFAPYFVQIKKIIESGVLGRLVQVSCRFNSYIRRWDWQCCQDHMGGSLYNTGPHPVDQLLNILDMYDGMPQVFCKMDRVNTFGDAEDYVKLILTAPNKPLIDLEVSCCDGNSPFTYSIQGQNGFLKSTTTSMEWSYFKPEEEIKQQLIKTPLTNADGEPAYCSEKLTWYKENWEINSKDPQIFTVATKQFYENLYEHITKNTPLAVPLYQVKQQIAVIHESHLLNPLSTF